MEIKINKEIRKINENIVLGMNLRETIWSGGALITMVITYALLYGKVSSKISVIAMAAIAAICAFMGFFNYHGLSAEKWIMVIIRNELCTPKEIICVPRNIYCEKVKKGDSTDAIKKFCRRDGSKNTKISKGCDSTKEDIQ